MLIDTAQLPTDDIHTDLCMIGTGPAALTLAHILGAEREMVLLEAGGEQASEASQALYRGRNVGLPYFDLDGCRSRQFGGSANCWGGFCRIFDAHDFDVRPRIPASGWPVTYAEMLPYFERAHALCHLGPVDYSYARWAPASGQAPSPFTGPHVTPEIRQKARFDVAAVKSSSTRP
jgi:choline dehydrogenase-like flavoprotein